MIIHTDFKQGSEEWRRIRLGKPTASRFDEIITPAKGELSKSSKNYCAELVGELLTDGFEDVKPIWSPHIERGIEHEERAFNAYNLRLDDAVVRQVGFISSDDDRAGCSPDGLVYPDESTPFEDPIGGVEFKCPTLANYLLWESEGVLPLAHKCQVHGSLAITGLPWWDFVAFNANVPDRLFVVRVYPDAFTKAVLAALDQFLAQRDEMLAKLRQIG